MRTRGPDPSAIRLPLLAIVSGAVSDVLSDTSGISAYELRVEYGNVNRES